MNIVQQFINRFNKKMAQLTYSWQYGRPVWSTQKDEAYIKEAYHKIVWVYACIGMISSCASSVPWTLYRKRGNNMTEIEDHPILKMVNQYANPYLSSRDFFDIWATYLAIQGKFYGVKNNSVLPTQLEFIYPHRVRPIPDKQKFVSGFEYDVDGNRTIYKADQIIWSKFFDPLDAYEGLSPIRAMARTIDTENEAVDWNKSMLQNSAVPPGALSAVNIDPAVKEKLRDEWVSRYGGAKNSRVPLIFDAEKVSYTNFGFNPIDMDFLEQRKLNRVEICSGFGVPGQVVGDPEGQTYANYEEALKAFWQNTVIPKYLDNIKGILNKDIVQAYADNLILDYNLDDITVLHESIDSIAERIRGLFKDNLITQDEAREAIGYDKAKKDGDMFNYELSSKILMMNQELADKDNSDDDKDKDDEGKKKALITDELSRISYGKAFDESRNKYINKLQDSVKKLFGKERIALKKAYEQITDTNKMLAASNKVIDGNRKNWINAITAAYLVVIEAYGKDVFSELSKTKASNYYNVYDNAVAEYIATTTGEKITYIDDTTRNDIKGIIENGIAEGYSIQSIANMIDTLYLDQYVPNRSELIAQTEVVAASNYGSYSAALQSGADVKKFWIFTLDTRTRDSHLAMGRHPAINLDQRFNVGRSKMLYPGDPNGEKKEVIRCRCTIGYKRIEGSD